MSKARATRGGGVGAAAAPATQDRLVRLLTPGEFADLICVSEATVERWRGQGEGPPFVKVSGKVVRYREVDVQAFIAARHVVSTAQAGG